MFRKCLLSVTAIMVMTLAIPSVVSAYFPPPTGTPTAVPPDPFIPPTGGGVGEPEEPDVTGQPTVATPEPASFISAATALVLLAGYTLHRRRQLAS